MEVVRELMVDKDIRSLRLGISQLKGSVWFMSRIGGFKSVVLIYILQLILQRTPSNSNVAIHEKVIPFLDIQISKILGLSL